MVEKESRKEEEEEEEEEDERGDANECFESNQVMWEE